MLHSHAHRLQTDVGSNRILQAVGVPPAADPVWEGRRLGAGRGLGSWRPRSLSEHLVHTWNSVGISEFPWGPLGLQGWARQVGGRDGNIYLARSWEATG